MKTISTFALTVFAAVALSACGGGGGGSTAAVTTPSAPSAPSTPTAPTVTPANLQTTVPAATYAASSPALQAFTRLNELRQKFGFGLLKQDANLDVSTQAHMTYSVANNSFDHDENSALPSYYATTPADRAALAGYGSRNVGEVLGIGVPGLTAVDDLFNSILHRSVMLNQSVTDIGVAAIVQGDFTPTVIDVGQKTTGQNNASDFVTVIPANQDTGVPLSMALESPSPFADVPTAQLPTSTTAPISVIVAASQTLTVTTFTVTENGQSTPLDVRLVTAATDPTKTVTTHEAHISGKAPFKANTTYNVSFIGAANGTTITKQWSFTTGAK